MIEFANCIILNENNEFLLQKKDMGHKYIPGNWSLFGGVIDGDEKPEQAIIREIKEEIGIKINEPKFLFKHHYVVKELEMSSSVFFIKIKNKIYDLKLFEGNGIAFFSSEEIEKNNVHFTTKEIIKKYLHSYPI